MRVTVSKQFGDQEWETMLAKWELELHALANEGDVTIIDENPDLTYGRSVAFYLELSPEAADTLKHMLAVFFGFDDSATSTSAVVWEEE